MSGAIVPNDWDGSTYKCYRVKWPQSEKYEAILLGNVSKPSYLDYWDAETGDAQEAADAIKTAYNTTLPDFWAEDCEDPILTTKSFRVRNTATQAVGAGVWTKVVFDEFVWNFEPITWNMTENAQDLTIPASAGIWQYNASVLTTTTVDLWLAIRLNNTFPIGISRHPASNITMVGTAWNVAATSTWLNLWILADVATVIQSNANVGAWLEGHLVKPMET